MSDASPLQPVFVPALAEVLAQAEKRKGAPLTEAELHRIRDGAVCIMMPEPEARRMDESRGYRDVNPENCLADWHRLKARLTGRGYLPKLILCLPGGDDFQARCEPLLRQAGVEHEFRGHEARMVEAFRASRCSVRPSLQSHDFEAISRHTSVLYILSGNFAFEQAATVSRRFLQLGRQLLEAGAVAIKCESSGIAHSAAYWRELASRVETDSPSEAGSSVEFWVAAYSAYVQLPLQSDTDFHSCGMHLLGQPDMIVACALMSDSLTARESAAQRAVDLFDGFGVYVFAECDERGFTSGHTFRLSANARRYRVLWEPCEGYEEDDFFFNPYGRWRFVLP